jgi:hypothetical protein
VVSLGNKNNENCRNDRNCISYFYGLKSVILVIQIDKLFSRTFTYFRHAKGPPPKPPSAGLREEQVATYTAICDFWYNKIVLTCGSIVVIFTFPLILIP